MTESTSKGATKEKWVCQKEQDDDGNVVCVEDPKIEKRVKIVFEGMIYWRFEEVISKE